MKLLMVCAGGLSTALLMKKMEAYWKEQNDTFDALACSLAEYPEKYPGFDIILVGPQIAYRTEGIARDTGLPTETINSTDYAMGRCANIYEQVKRLESQVKK